MRRITIVLALVLFASPLFAQLSGIVDRNMSQLGGAESECAITKNPNNKLQLFASCNSVAGALFAARSVDGGFTWTYPDAADKTIADGDAGQGRRAWSDPTLSWDTFGNLWIAYIDYNKSAVDLVRSPDGGASFIDVMQWTTCNGCADQPTVVAANTTAGGAPVALWLVWIQGTPSQLVATGAAVTGLGALGAFGATQTVGVGNCNYGDVAISPAGIVTQVCQTPTSGEGPGSIRVSIDADGLGAGNFGAFTTATTTNTGGYDYIPAQPNRSVDSEPGLAYDINPLSPHVGRLYLVYTEEVGDESNDMDVMVRFSDNNGGSWSAAQRVNDDATTRSQFLPKIASNRLSGNVGVCWHDARNSAGNTAMQVYCTLATPAGATPAFFANAPISGGASTSAGSGMDFGDYSGLAYHQGILHPAWGDTSNSTGNNPNLTGNFDAYTDRVWGGPAANEGDPHLKTVDGVHYDFQSSGEFVVLRDYGGTEIQTRQVPVPSAGTPTDPYDGLSPCVSVNGAFAARVGRRRVTYEPDLSGQPNPDGLQLRIDGVLTTLPAGGIDLGGGGRVDPAGGGGSITVDFPDGTRLLAVPAFWTSQSVWYMNVDVFDASAMLGINGAIAANSWLPALPNGSSIGAMPASLHDRYVVLYEKFADAWRVNDTNTLFDYAPGTSTKDFTVPGWPLEKPPCDIRGKPPVTPLDEQAAREACRAVEDKNRMRNCVFDVMATGEKGFADTYGRTQRIIDRATATTFTDNGAGGFTVSVAPRYTDRRKSNPAGTVYFTIDGRKVEKPVRTANGTAVLRAPDLPPGEHLVTARFVPADTTQFESSTVETTVVVRPRMKKH